MKLVNKKGINVKDSEYFQNFKEKAFTGHKKIPSTIDWNVQGNLLASAENNIRIWAFE